MTKWKVTILMDERELLGGEIIEIDPIHLCPDCGEIALPSKVVGDLSILNPHLRPCTCGLFKMTNRLVQFSVKSLQERHAEERRTLENDQDSEAEDDGGTPTTKS